MSKKALLISCCLVLLLTIIYYFYFPNNVAIHFDSNGIPDSWTNKNINFLIEAFIYLLITGIFFSIPLIIKNTPSKFVNIPNKQYWLAPERKTYTSEMISNTLCWVGVGLNFFFIILGFIVLKTNMLRNVVLDNSIVYILLLALTVYMSIWLIKLYIRLKKTV